MAKYTIYRDDRWDSISANSFEELKKLRSEGNHKYISHYYGSVAECYNRKTHSYEYYDIYSEEQVTADGKYVYESYSMGMYYMSLARFYDGKPLTYEEMIKPVIIKSSKPYPPYTLLLVNKAWRDNIKTNKNKLN